MKRELEKRFLLAAGRISGTLRSIRLRCNENNISDLKAENPTYKEIYNHLKNEYDSLLHVGNVFNEANIVVNALSDVLSLERHLNALKLVADAIEDNNIDQLGEGLAILNDLPYI